MTTAPPYSAGLFVAGQRLSGSGIRILINKINDISTGSTHLGHDQLAGSGAAEHNPPRHDDARWSVGPTGVSRDPADGSESGTNRGRHRARGHPPAARGEDGRHARHHAARTLPERVPAAGGGARRQSADLAADADPRRPVNLGIVWQVSTELFGRFRSCDEGFRWLLLRLHRRWRCGRGNRGLLRSLGFEVLLHCSSPVDPPRPRRSPCQIVPFNLPGNSGRPCHLPPKVTALTCRTRRPPSPARVASPARSTGTPTPPTCYPAWSTDAPTDRCSSPTAAPAARSPPWTWTLPPAGPACPTGGPPRCSPPPPAGPSTSYATPGSEN